MFTICLSNLRFSLSIFSFAHCHVAHSFVLSICFFHFNPHVLISSNYLKGSKKVGSLGYSKGIFIILHNLSNMLEIKVYSNIPLGCEEVVFGLTHNFWLWTNFVHHFCSSICIFHPFYLFICFIFSPIFASIFIFHPWTCGKIFFHVL